MNLRDLEYFISLAEIKHFRKAAEACFVSQPTLSGQIKKLEEELGLILINRNSKQVKLTRAGESLLPYAYKVLQGVDEIKMVATEYKNPFEGKVKLALIPTIAPYLLPLIHGELRQKFPKINFEIYEKKTSEILEELKTNQIDVGILALPIDDQELTEIPVYNESFYLVHDDKTIVENTDNLDYLSNNSLYLLEEGHCFRNQILSLCSLNKDDTIPFTASSLESIKALIMSSGGISMIPELTKKHWKNESPQLEYLEFNDPQPARSVGLIHRKNSFRNECYKDMATVIENIVKPLISKRLNHIINPL